MTRRANFLAALRREPHEYTPAYFAVDNFNTPDGLPEGMIDSDRLQTYSNPEEIIEASRYLGLDVVLRLTPNVVLPDQGQDSEDLGNGLRTTSWRTRRGVLRQVEQRTEAGGTSFIVEHPISKISDYGVFLDYITSCEYHVSSEGIAKTRRLLEIVADSGIAYAVCPSTPIMDLARVWVGQESLVYHLADEPRLVESVLDAMAELAYRQYELIADHSPCQVLVLYDDANSLTLSRQMFERYCVPVLQRYAQIAHRHGKILVNHTCGKIAAFLDLYLMTGNDSIDWLTPPPTGDVDPNRARDALGRAMSIQMALVPTTLRYGTPSEVRAHVRELLSPSDRDSGFILLIPTPNGSPLANSRTVVQELNEEFGYPPNRSALFGSILESR